MSRDAQRQKVYNAERKWEHLEGDTELLTIPEAQEWLDLLVGIFKTGPVRIQRNARIQQWGAWYKRYPGRGIGPVVECPGHQITLKTLGHEFAHHLEAERREDISQRTYWDPGHGGAYTAAHLDVVEALYGPESRDAMGQQYAAGNVTVGVEAATEKQEKQAQRLRRNLARRGEQGTLYLVQVDCTWHASPDTCYLAANHFVSRSRWGAQTFRTLKGAKAAAARRYRKSPKHIYQTSGSFRCDYDGSSPSWELDSTLRNGTDPGYELVETWTPEDGWQEIAQAS